MNSSAKFTLTLLAAGALGAVAFACSVGSGTVDDTDGGTNTSTSSSSSGSTTSSSSSSSGDSGPPPAACPQLTYPNAIDSKECEACLETSCCAETAGCWNQADKQGASLGCFDYAQALICCDGEADDPATQCGAGYEPPKTQADVDSCKGYTKPAAIAGIPAAYDTYLSCRESKCAGPCGGFGTADAGPPQ